jgi:putative peptide zinc metalloprotease protein
MMPSTTPRSPNDPAAESATVPTPIGVPERPRLAPNVQVVGEVQESGFQDRQWLIQRDRQFIQVTELLYRVAEQADGCHTLEEIAAGVTEATDWIVGADQVRQLVQVKLLPLGLVSAADGSVVAGDTNRSRSPLPVNLHMRMLSPDRIDPFTKLLQVLYASSVLLPLLILIVIAHAWLYLVHGIRGSLQATLSSPGLLLLVLALILVSSIFHELGHAAGLRYSGGQVRGIGVGLYLYYPMLYTDTTDSYRLGRWARVRTSLGGFYFPPGLRAPHHRRLPGLPTGVLVGCRLPDQPRYPLPVSPFRPLRRLLGSR